jgi:predicted nucleic acid-binding protein
MSFFVDANPLIYAAGDGQVAEGCLRVLEAIAAGEADGRTSAAVLEEAWHISQRDDQGQLDGLVESALTIFTPPLPVTEAVFRRALTLEATAIGTNDRLHAATCMVEGIETIFSADQGFDQVAGLHRVDPFDADAVDRLLAA